MIILWKHRSLVPKMFKFQFSPRNHGQLYAFSETTLIWNKITVDW